MEGGSNDGKPNLTPILDMVFQLITFFMLVINFKAAALDMNLKLPVVGSARPVESAPGEEVLVLNVDDKGALKVYGAAVDVGSYIANEAETSRLAARRANSSFQDTDDLPTIVVIRAHREIAFHSLFHVIKACQDHGYRRFALKAMNQETGT